MEETSEPAGRWGSRTRADPDDGQPLANLLYSAKMLVAARPTLAVATARIRRPHHALRRDTAVVIEGYPKSANGFVSHAFKMAQEHSVRVAHTTHASGQVIAGCRRHIPALVLIRPAPNAVSRTALVRPQISLELLLRGWIRFYRPLIPWRERFAVGAFAAVTSDLGAVMTAMNERLGTRFTPFEHTPENEQEAFRALEDDWATRIPRGEIAHEVYSGRPAAQRDAMNAEIRAKLDAPRYQGLLQQASDLYDEIVES
jgi:hypothetical protein